MEFLVTMKSQPAHSLPPLHVPDGCSRLNLGLWEFLRVMLCIQFLGYCGKNLHRPGSPRLREVDSPAHDVSGSSSEEVPSILGGSVPKTFDENSLLS